MLDDVLSHVVSVLVNNQVGSTYMQFFQYVRLRRFMAILQHALNDPTAIWMRREMVNLVRESVDDKRNMLRRNSLNGLLDHMIPILILDALEYLVLELFD